MEGGRPEKHVADPRKMGMEETSRRQRRMEASCERDQGPVGAVRRRWNGMLKAIVRSYMTGPIEGSSVETQARYWIFKIVLVDFQRPVPPVYVTVPMIRHPFIRHSALSDTAKCHAIYNFLLLSHAQTKTLMYRRGQEKNRAFKSITRNGAPVSYKKENNAWIDSEIF